MGRRTTLVHPSQGIRPLAQTSRRIVGPSRKAYSASLLGRSETIYGAENGLSTASRYDISTGSRERGGAHGLHNDDGDWRAQKCLERASSYFLDPAIAALATGPSFACASRL